MQEVSILIFFITDFLKEKEVQWKILICCSTYTITNIVHSLVGFLCSLTRDQTHNIGISEGH